MIECDFVSSYENDNIPKVIAELGYFMKCISNDFHYMHLLMAGEEFDTMHKEVLKTYYEEADADYDEYSEWAVGLDYEIVNASEAASAIDYNYIKQTDKFNKSEAVEKCDDLLKWVVQTTSIVLNNIPDCCYGLANYIQGRLEYWTKEYIYFNKRRK